MLTPERLYREREVRRLLEAAYDSGAGLAEDASAYANMSVEDMNSARAEAIARVLGTE